MPDIAPSLMPELKRMADTYLPKTEANPIEHASLQSVPDDILSDLQSMANKYIPMHGTGIENIKTINEPAPQPQYSKLQMDVLKNTFGGSEKGNQRLDRIISGEEPIPYYAKVSDAYKGAVNSVKEFEKIKKDHGVGKEQITEKELVDKLGGDYKAARAITKSIFPFLFADDKKPPIDKEELTGIIANAKKNKKLDSLMFKLAAAKEGIRHDDNEGFTKDERERIIKQAEVDQGVSRNSPDFDWTNALLQIKPGHKKTVEEAAYETGKMYGKIPVVGAAAGGIFQGAHRLTGGIIAIGGMLGSKNAEAAGKKIYDIVNEFGAGEAETENRVDRYVRGAADSMTQMYMGSFVPGGQYLAPAISQAGDSYYTGKKAGLKGKSLAGYVAGNAAAEIAYALLFKGIAKVSGKAGIEGVERIFGRSGSNIFKSGMAEIAKDFGWSAFGELTEEEMTSFTQAFLSKFYKTDINSLDKDRAKSLFVETALQTLMTLGLSHVPHYSSNMLKNRSARNNLVDSILNHYGVKNPTKEQREKALSILKQLSDVDNYAKTEAPSRRQATKLPDSVRKLANDSNYTGRDTPLNLNNADDRKAFSALIREKGVNPLPEAESLMEQNAAPEAATKPTVEAKPEQPVMVPEQQTAATEAVPGHVKVNPGITIDKPGLDAMTTDQKKAFKSQLDIEIADLKASGFTDEQIKTFQKSALYGAEDKLTGMQAANLRQPTMDRAIEHVKESGEPGVYAEIDIANLGGLNAAKGHEGANKVYSEFADIIKDEVSKLSGSINTFRHGGDEMSVIAVGIDDNTLRTALDNAKKRASEVAKREGVADIIHPKHENNLLFNGVGLEYDTAKIIPGKSSSEIFAAADTKLELRKKQREIEGGENVKQTETAPAGAVTPSGQTARANGGVAETGGPVQEGRGSAQPKAEKVIPGEVTPSKSEQDEVKRAIDIINADNLPDDIKGVIGQVGGFVRDESTLSKIRNRMKELALEAMKKPDPAKAEQIAVQKIKRFMFKAGKKLGVYKAGMSLKRTRSAIQDMIEKQTGIKRTDTSRKISKTQKQLHKTMLKAQEKASSEGHKAGKKEGKKEGALKATYKQSAITYLQNMIDPANVGDLLNQAKKIHTESGLMKFMGMVDQVAHGEKILPERVLMTKKALDKMMQKVAEKHAKINMRAGQERILNVHRFLEEHARKLPPAVRGKVLNAIVNAKTINQFNKAVEKIDVEAAHTEHRKAIADTKKTIKAIKKRYQADLMSMNPHYRDLMNNLIGALDTTKLSEKKRKYAENLLELISEDKSIYDRLNKSNRRLLERVGRESLSDMSTEELTDLRESIKLIEFRQKRMRTYKKNGKMRKVAEVVDGVNKTMKKVIDDGLAVGTKKGEKAIANRGFMRKTLDYFGIGSKLMLELADAMDGNGPLMTSIGNSIQEAGDAHERNNAEIEEYISKAMEKRGLTNKDYERWGGGKKTDIIEVKLKSKDKNGKQRVLRMNKWTLASMALTLMDNKGGKIALRNRLHYAEPVKSNVPGQDVTYRDVMDDLGGGERGIQLGRPVNRKNADNRFESAQADADAIIQAAKSDKKLAAWMDLFRDFADNKAFPMLNEAIIESEDRELRKEANWMPLKREKKGLSAAISILDSYNEKYNTLKDYQSRKDRTSAENYDLRINPLNQIFADTAKNVSAINAFQSVADDISAIFGQEEVNVALDRMHGKGFSAQLIERLNAVMGNVDEPKSVAQRIARTVKSRITGAKLLASPSVLVSQSLSYLEAATEIDAKYLLNPQVLKGENSKENRAILNEVRSNEVSPKLKARKEGRGFDRDLKDRAHVDAFDKLTGNKNWYQDASGKPMSHMDNVAISRIILAANKQAQVETGKGSTDKETILKTKEIAERAIDNTQVSSEVFNRTGFSQTRNGVLRLFGFFRGYLDANLQNTIRSIFRYRYQHKNKSRLAKDLAITQVLPTITNMSRKAGYAAAVNMIAAMILGYKEPDDKEKKDALEMAHKLTVELAQEGLGKVPILGNSAKGAIEWMKSDRKWYNIQRSGDVTGPVSSSLSNVVKIPWYMRSIVENSMKIKEAKSSRVKRRLEIAQNKNIIHLLESAINLGSETTGVPVEGAARPVIKALKLEQKAKEAGLKRKKKLRRRRRSR